MNMNARIAQSAEMIARRISDTNEAPHFLCFVIQHFSYSTTTLF